MPFTPPSIITKVWRNASQGAPFTYIGATGLNDLEDRIRTWVNTAATAVADWVEDQRGAPNGVAALDANGRLDHTQLGTGGDGSGSRLLTDASTYVMPSTLGTSNGLLPLADFDIVGDGSNELTKLNTAATAAQSQGRPLLGLLDSTSRTVTVGATWAIADNNFRMAGNGLTITTTAGSPTYPVLSWSETGGGTGRGANGWIEDLTIDPAAGSVVNGSKGVVVNGVIGFRLEGIRVYRCWLGIDMLGNPYGHTVQRCWTDPGNVIYGLMVRRGSSSGNDNAYIENWWGGFRSGVFIEGASGGFRFRGGQINVGSGTTSTATGYGGATLGDTYDDATGAGTGTALGETINVVFDGTSWEGGHDRPCIRSYGRVDVTVTNNSNFNLDSGGTPTMDCIWRATTMGASTVTIEQSHIFGYQQAANPLEWSGFSTTGGELHDHSNDGVLNVGSSRTAETGTALVDFAGWPLGAQSGLGAFRRTSRAAGRIVQTGPWQTDKVVVPRVVTPWDVSLLAWPYPALLASGTVTPATGSVRMIRMLIPEPTTVANINLRVSTLSADATNVYGGLYSLTGTLIAKTANQAAAVGSTGYKTWALTAEAGQDLSLGSGWYYAAILQGGGTAAAFNRQATDPSLYNAGLAAADRYLVGSSGSGLTALPSSITTTSLTANDAPWMGLS